jgi:putative membrane protein
VRLRAYGRRRAAAPTIPCVTDALERDVDPRFSLANERTFLSWIRTALALIVGGVVAAKGLDFHHEVVRWALAGPPIVAGALLAIASHRRWRTYDREMRQGRPLTAGRGLVVLAIAIAVYALVALVGTALDG